MNARLATGLALLAAIVLAAVAGPAWIGIDPFEMRAAPFTPPLQPEAWLGTDHLGRDVLAQLLHGARTTLQLAFGATLLAMAIGIAAGAVVGFRGGLAGAALLRVIEFFQVLPPLLLAMVLVTLWTPRPATQVVAIAAVTWPGIARLARGEMLRLAALDFVRAQRAIGARPAHTLWRVLLPNAAPALIVAGTLAVGTAILLETGLAFLGLGDPNRMSWGLMIGEARAHVLEAWWAIAFPGAAIFLTVLGVSLLGEGVDTWLDPRRD